MRSFFDHIVYSKERGYRITRHVLFWLLYFRLFQFMMEVASPLRANTWALLFLPINASFVYFVLYRLVPRYLMRFAYWSFFLRYCLAMMACLTIDFFLGYRVIYTLLPPLPFDAPTTTWRALATILDPAQFSVVNVMAGVGVFIKIYKFWRAEVWLKLQVAQEKAHAELELLKVQLQPQFLKNTLTHLYALMKAGSQKPPELLMRLSAILSYILYECREAEVPLEREIAICKEYIALESERHGDRLDVSVDLFGSFTGKRIAPLILLPLVGNAFPDQERTAQPRWMAFEFSTQADQLLVRVIDGKTGNPELRAVRGVHASLHAYIDRLKTLYGDRVTFTRKEREDDDIISLTIELEQSVRDRFASRVPNDGSLFRNAVFD